MRFLFCAIDIAFAVCYSLVIQYPLPFNPPATNVVSDEQFTIDAEFAKADEKHGLIFGYAIICKKDGSEYFDKQGDHIPEESMLTEALDFMENSRVAGLLHTKDSDGNIIKTGSVPFAFPLTTDIAKELDIDAKWTGLLIAMKPDKATLQKFISGELRSFSIGGRRIHDVPVEE